MDLQDAIEQYVDILTLGAKALRRLATNDLDEPLLDALSALVNEIVDRAELLKALLSGRSFDA